MTSSNVDRLAVVIAQVLNVEVGEVSDESSPQTIANWDSLNHLNLIMAIEHEFAISLDPEDVLEMHEVSAIREILRLHSVSL